MGPIKGEHICAPKGEIPEGRGVPGDSFPGTIGRNLFLLDKSTDS